MIESPNLMQVGNRTVHIVATQHFDILWRRPLAYYRQVQTKVIKHVLKIIDEYPEFRFVFHQANVLRYFVKNHPKEAEILRQRVRQGAIEIAGGMETIPDTNMVSGESLVRNIVYGKQWIHSYFGIEPAVGSLLDCFGSSAQLPQIFAGTGHQTLLAGRMPGAEFSDSAAPAAFLWRGLDGTIIKGINIAFDIIHEKMIGGWYGWGILEGVDDELYEIAGHDEQGFIRDIRGGLGNLISNPKSGKTILAVLSGEEHLPRKELVPAIHRFAQDKDHIIKLSTFDKFINDMDWNNGIDYLEGEYNVEFTGCYTTRIELKQQNQCAETALYNAEYLLSMMMLLNHDRYNPELLKNEWRSLFVGQFHDSICGCHIDENYHHIVAAFDKTRNNAESQIAESMDKINEVSGGDSKGRLVWVVNTLPFARKDIVRIKCDEECVHNASDRAVACQRDGDDLVLVTTLPSGGGSVYTISQEHELPISHTPKSSSDRIQVGRYLISESDRGLHVVDCKLDRTVFTEGEITPQIVLKEDVGTLWTEEFTGLEWREKAGRSKRESFDIGDVFAKIRYIGQVSPKEVSWDGFEGLNWQKTVYIYKDIDRIDVHIDLDFSGRATEVSLLFPINVNAASSQCRYEIPFGSVVREPYSKDCYKYGRGNWPALSWCDYCDEHFGVTLVHTGTPGCVAKEGKISFSVLRSAPSFKKPFFPTKPEPLSFDNGKHHFEFAIIPHKIEDQTWLREAKSFIVRPVTGLSGGTIAAPFVDTALISIDKPNVVLSAFKPAENGHGLIIRIYEIFGQRCQTSIKIACDIHCAIETSLDEIQDGESIYLDEITLKPFEVKTIRLLLM